MRQIASIKTIWTRRDDMLFFEIFSVYKTLKFIKHLKVLTYLSKGSFKCLFGFFSAKTYAFQIWAQSEQLLENVFSKSCYNSPLTQKF